MKTMQEVYDIAVGGVVQQGRRSIKDDSSPACQLRGARGAKCAVGWVIPDSAYNPMMEHYGYLGEMADLDNSMKSGTPRVSEIWLEFLNDAVEEAVVEGVGGEPDDRMWAMLVELQHEHDQNEGFEDVVTGFADVAKAYGLSDAIIEKCQSVPA